MFNQKYLFQLAISLILVSLLVACARNNSTVDSGKIVHPDWSRNATIYEVNIRQYTPEGTFKAFEEHLPKIKEMGIDILWLMPINPIGELNRKGTLGSYYSVKDYEDVNPEFGTVEDFKNLVNKIHEMGMYVIIDWVANHTAWDNVWVKNHPDFFNLDSSGNFYPPVADWHDVIDLNYDNPQLRDYMIKAMKYWVQKCDIDGFRCDVAAMVPTEFWDRTRKELDEIKQVFMLAEASESYLQEKAFDMTYNWSLKDIMNEIAKGEKDASDIIDYYNYEKEEYDPDDYIMTFTSNHDENTWHGTALERLGYSAEMFAVLISTVKGMPLVYNGQEAGLDKRLEFFEKDLIDWKDHKFYNMYKKLFALKHHNKSLWNGTAGGEMNFITSIQDTDVLAFAREKDDDKIIAVFNLTGKDQNIKLKSEVLKGYYRELFTNSEFAFESDSAELFLPAWGYMVLVKE